MEESFLHFIWEFQQFSNRKLFSDSNEAITVIDPGIKNHDAGPDFKNAKIKIADIVWNGNVEIHVKASDWYRHNHQDDLAYDNVVLHVVWKNDYLVSRKDNSTIPTLELRNNIDDQLILNHDRLLTSRNEILCSRYLAKISSLTIYQTLDKVLTERLMRKSNFILQEIAFTDGDWEEIAWRMLCKNFGFKTNSEPFYDLGQSVPFKILKKESYDQLGVEAILFGQAGFLQQDDSDPYYRQLQKEYQFKQSKYGLGQKVQKHHWKFLRLRPANFPTIRIAQLATFIKNNSNLFSSLTNFESADELRKNLEAKQSVYWQEHYNFSIAAKSKVGRLGKASIDNILINTVVPLLFTYGVYKDNQAYKERALELLSSLKPEKNAKVNKWVECGVTVANAFDSQAVIELLDQYCLRKKCLNCAIGCELIRSDK